MAFIIRSGFFISSIFFFTRVPDFFFFASVNACATLILLAGYRYAFSSFGFDPLLELGLLLFDVDEADDLFRLLLGFNFLRSIGVGHQI